LAVANYAHTHKHYPPAFVAGKDGRPAHSWRTLILPYINGKELFDAVQFEEPWNSDSNQPLAPQMPRTYALHGEEYKGNTTTNYLAVVGAETMWPGATGLPVDVLKDRSSRTIMIVENKGAKVHWMEPRDLQFASMDFTLGSANGISSRFVDPAVVTADCSVRRITPNITPETLIALLSVTSKDNIGLDENDGWHILPDGRNRPVAEP
jgi:hypothetical protein